MKSKTNLFFAILILTTLNIFGQTPSGNFKIGSYSYPKPCVSNFIKWLDLSTMEWETEMKKYEFSDRGIENGCVYYASGASIENAVFSITKCPGNVIGITWNDFSRKGITKLDFLISEIEPYYKKTDANGSSIYTFRNGSFAYEFSVTRDNSFEFVIVKKYSLQE